MSLFAINPGPSRRLLRQLGWVFALILAITAATSHLSALGSLALQLLAALVFAFATIWPGLFRWAFLALQALAYPLARLTGSA